MWTTWRVSRRSSKVCGLHGVPLGQTHTSPADHHACLNPNPNPTSSSPPGLNLTPTAPPPPGLNLTLPAHIPPGVAVGLLVLHEKMPSSHSMRLARLASWAAILLSVSHLASGGVEGGVVGMLRMMGGALLAVSEPPSWLAAYLPKSMVGRVCVCVRGGHGLGATLLLSITWGRGGLPIMCVGGHAHHHIMCVGGHAHHVVYGAEWGREVHEATECVCVWGGGGGGA